MVWILETWRTLKSSFLIRTNSEFLNGNNFPLWIYNHIAWILFLKIISSSGTLSLLPPVPFVGKDFNKAFCSEILNYISLYVPPENNLVHILHYFSPCLYNHMGKHICIHIHFYYCFTQMDTRCMHLAIFGFLLTMLHGNKSLLAISMSLIHFLLVLHNILFYSIL